MDIQSMMMNAKLETDLHKQVGLLYEHLLKVKTEFNEFKKDVEENYVKKTEVQTISFREFVKEKENE